MIVSVLEGKTINVDLQWFRQKLARDPTNIQLKNQIKLIERMLS